ncbi:MAG: ABC transporter substrate-binding protein [Ilumatobacteraceae bacterium]
MYQPHLAATAEPNEDGSVWTVRLRDGVTFHDGAPLTTDAVLSTIEYINGESLAGSGHAATLVASGITPQATRKLDSLTVEFELPAPDALFTELLSTFFVLPPDPDFDNPVGTGPFVFKSFDPGQEAAFTANPEWWGSDGPWVEELILKDIEDDTARVNALIAGQVDAISSLPYSQVAIVESTSGIQPLINDQATTFNFLFFRTDIEPFNDVRVLQAIKLVLDREEIINQAVSGYAWVGNDVFGQADPAFDSSLPQRVQDIEAAKSLLAEAGMSDLSFDLTVAPIGLGVVETCEILVTQAAKAGITVTLNHVDAATLFGPQYMSWPAGVDVGAGTGFLTTASYLNAPGAGYNVSHFDHPEYNELYTRARSTLDVQERSELIARMCGIVYDEDGIVIPFFPYVIDAASTKTTGWKTWKGGEFLNAGHLEQIALVE